MLGVGSQQLLLIVAALHFMAIAASVKYHQLIAQES